MYRVVLWNFVCCECCVLSSRGLCDGLILRTEESYECMSDGRVVCCQIEFCATGRSLLHRRRMDVCLSWVLCVNRYRSMRGSYHMYRGFLWMSVCCECFVLPGRGLCELLITFTQESYGWVSVLSVVCCQVIVCATGWSLVQRSAMDVCWLGLVCDVS